MLGFNGSPIEFIPSIKAESDKIQEEVEDCHVCGKTALYQKQIKGQWFGFCKSHYPKK